MRDIVKKMPFPTSEKDDDEIERRIGS